MNTIKTFEDLQELGCNSIHENTHITRAKVEAILNKSFDELTKVQFMGFLSILEREYKLDLSSLREEYDAYVQQNVDMLTPQKSVILQAQSRARRVWIIGAIIAVMLLLGISWMVQGKLSVFPTEDVLQLSTASIEVPEENLSIEINASSEVNATDLNTSQAVLSPIPEDNKDIITDTAEIDLGHVQSIKPLYKVWVGMMNLDTGVKTQRLTDRPIIIDTTKNWLFMFGHGRLKIETLDKNITLEEKNTVWFSCENGKLIQLNHKQFQAKNKGKNW